MKARKGFTLIELLIVIGIIVILAGVVIIALNPARQFALARNSQRWSNVNAILNAVGQRMAENKGIWSPSGCTGAVGLTTIPTSSVTQIGHAAGLVDLEACLVPNYLAGILLDPRVGTTTATGYWILQETTGRITVSAPEGIADVPGSDTITVSR